MNLYLLSAGNIRYYVAAPDEQGAYEQGTDPQRFPDLHYRPFEIDLIQVEGYTITVTPEAQETQETAPKRKKAAG